MKKRRIFKNRRNIKMIKRKEGKNRRKFKIIKDPAIVNFLSEHLKPIKLDFSKIKAFQMTHSK